MTEGGRQATEKIQIERQPGVLLWPLKAIRSHCLGCVGGVSRDVALCPITSCPLWPYRFGSRTRAHAIAAEERQLGRVEGKYWADRLRDAGSGLPVKPGKGQLAPPDRP